MAPNALFTLYTRLPNFKADHAMMYTVLTHFYNDDYGYAFPSQYELCLRLNCGINKPTQLAKVLKEYGLIRYERLRAGGNYVYYLEEPIDTEEAFYEKFSQAKQYYEERVEALGIRKEAKEIDKQNMLDGTYSRKS